MQIVAVPLYNRDMTVEAYMFRDLKENNLFSSAQAINLFDGAATSEPLRILDSVGLDAFTLGKPIFIPIKEVLLMGNPQLQCKVPADKIVFVLEEPISDNEVYLPIIKSLRDMGYRFAANYKIHCQRRDSYLDLCSFVFFSQRPERVEETSRGLEFVKHNYRHLALIAAHIYSKDVLQGLYDKGYSLYESKFYRVTEAGFQIAPLKINAIRLINIVQDENFEFENISGIVRGDPALTVSLLKLINSTVGSSKNSVSSVPQAVALLGQGQVRKWVTTAVSRSLGNDRPNEITRTSLVRAKFCENLAPHFDMAQLSSDLFLLGLFSVLDIILEMPMDRAIKQVHISKNVSQALTEGSGILYPVIKFVTDYESASWSAVSRQMIVSNISDENLSEAYLDALRWYRELLTLDAAGVSTS